MWKEVRSHDEENLQPGIDVDRPPVYGRRLERNSRSGRSTDGEAHGILRPISEDIRRMSLRARIETMAMRRAGGYARWRERLAVQSALWGMALAWSRFLGFFQTLLLAGWLGPADFGRFSALQSGLRFGHESGESGLSMLIIRDLTRGDTPRVSTYMILRGSGSRACAGWPGWRRGERWRPRRSDRSCRR